MLVDVNVLIKKKTYLRSAAVHGEHQLCQPRSRSALLSLFFWLLRLLGENQHLEVLVGEDTILSLIESKKVCAINVVIVILTDLLSTDCNTKTTYCPQSPQPQKKDLHSGSWWGIHHWPLNQIINFKEVYPKLLLKLQKAGGETEKSEDSWALMFCGSVVVKTNVLAS